MSTKRINPPPPSFWVDNSPQRARRRALKVSQAQLAKALGLGSYMTIARIERNLQSPTLEQHVAIARALGVPGTQLYAVIDGTRPDKT